MAAKTRAVAQRLVRDAPLRDLVIRCAGTFLNMVLAIFNLLIACGNNSLWNYAMAGYFAVLTFMGSCVAVCMKRPGQQPIRRVFRVSAVFLCALAVAFGMLMGVCISQRHSERLPQIFMILMAAFTFATTGMAVVDVVRIRNGSPLQQVIAHVNIAGAVGALLVLEIQMLGTFGNPAGQLAFVIEAISGAVAVLIVFLMGCSLFWRANALGRQSANAR